MIGYGLLNSKIQEFCLKGIITSFLNRSVIFLYCLYLNYKDKNNDEKKQILDSLFDIFIKEELKLQDRIFNNFSDFKQWENSELPKSTTAYYIDDSTKDIVKVEYNEEGTFVNFKIAARDFNDYSDLIVKYILSANVIYNKDYDFSSKSSEQVISEGKENLKKLFIETFEEFYNSEYFSSSEQVENKTIDFEAYYQSFKNLLEEQWLYVYNNVIDTSESDFEDWWKYYGIGFTLTLQDIVAYLKKTKDAAQINENKEKQNLINFIDLLKQKLSNARSNAPTWFDIYDGISITKTITLEGKEIIPTDQKGLQIELKLVSSFRYCSSKCDFQIQYYLDYIKQFVDFYYKKITGQIKTNYSIKSTIKSYINSAQTLVTPNSFINEENDRINLWDTEELTLYRLSIYFIKQNRYLENYYELRDSFETTKKPGIFYFYKNNKLLEDRSYYLKLLNGQINSMQEIKVDEEEKYFI